MDTTTEATEIERPGEWPRGVATGGMDHGVCWMFEPGGSTSHHSWWFEWVERPDFDGTQPCQKVGLEAFFDQPGQAARTACSMCPIKQECAEYAIAHERGGYWGGLSEEERRRIRRQRHQVCIEPHVFEWFLLDEWWNQHDIGSLTTSEERERRNRRRRKQYAKARLNTEEAA